MRELYEADFHKPGIYGSGRVWANAWDVFFRALSRGGRGRRAAVDFVACFECGRFFFRDFRVTTFPNSYIQSSQRRIGEGAPTAGQSAHRELVPTYLHQVYRLVCSHLRNMASSVDQYSSSEHKKSVWSPQQLFKLRETSRDCSRDKELRETYTRETSRHVFCHPRSRQGGAPILCGLLTGYVRHISFRVLPARGSI